LRENLERIWHDSQRIQKQVDGSIEITFLAWTEDVLHLQQRVGDLEVR
jgi:hypothetical protein